MCFFIHIFDSDAIIFRCLFLSLYIYPYGFRRFLFCYSDGLIQALFNL